jgi:DNA polymerase III subunit epsilon
VKHRLLFTTLSLVFAQKRADSLLSMREIVFDTETTGLSPANGDRLVEIGCVEMINRVESGRTYHCYFNPECPMAPAAQAIHGLSDSFLSDKALFADKVEDMLDFLEDSPLVAHNASFDFAFLNAELEASGRLHVSPSRMIDTLALARTKFPGAKHSLDALCSRFGVDRSHRVLHGALLDAQLLAQVYVELTGGKQIGLGLDPLVPRAFGSDEPLRTHARSAPRPARAHSASVAELERHRTFISQLVDPLWLSGEPIDVTPADA